MKPNNSLPVPAPVLSAMEEMRSCRSIAELESFNNSLPFDIGHDNDFIAEYKKFHYRLENGLIEQPVPVRHMNPVNRKYHCDNCDTYGVPLINQFDLHFCSTWCRDNYNWEAGAQQNDEERQRMDDTYIQRHYSNE